MSTVDPKITVKRWYTSNHHTLA